MIATDGRRAKPRQKAGAGFSARKKAVDIGAGDSPVLGNGAVGTSIGMAEEWARQACARRASGMNLIAVERSAVGERAGRGPDGLLRGQFRLNIEIAEPL